jgi:acyl-CoA thioester hydrolase
VAHERAAVEHRAAPPPQPRSPVSRIDEAQAGRSAGGDPRLTERPPFKFSAQTRVGFSDTDAQGIVYYGRYLPYFDLARVEYHRNLGLLGMDIGEEGEEFVMRALTVEYLAPAVFDDLIEIYVRMARIGRTSATYELAAYRTSDDLLLVTASQTLVLVDLDERKAVPIPDSYKEEIRSFEGEALEA